MNRSFQAFTILIISLAGAVVSVTWSMPAAKISRVPAKSAAVVTAKVEAKPSITIVETATVVPTYESSCGYDATTGAIYTCPSEQSAIVNSPQVQPANAWKNRVEVTAKEIQSAMEFFASKDFADSVDQWVRLANRPELVAEGPMGNWMDEIDTTVEVAATAPVEPALEVTSDVKPNQVVLQSAASTLDAFADLLHKTARDLSRVAEQSVAKSNTSGSDSQIVR